MSDLILLVIVIGFLCYRYERILKAKARLEQAVLTTGS